MKLLLWLPFPCIRWWPRCVLFDLFFARSNQKVVDFSFVNLKYYLTPFLSFSFSPLNHTHSLAKFASLSGIDVVPADISLAGRVLAAFPEKLQESQRVPDNLAYLGELSLSPDANIIKLPNISAPLNQLQACISELRSKGYDVPLYPTEPNNDEEKDIQKRYSKLMGSAVNPVLREGNSDRRVAKAVKAYAQKNPHRMGLWSKASRTHVAHMTEGDFYGTEKSVIVPQATSVSIVLQTENGETQQVLKKGIPMEEQEVMDAATMSVAHLRAFYEHEIEDAKESEVLLSLHLKATMMKVSDPIMFGHAIRAYYSDAYDKHGATLNEIGADPNSGLASIYERLENAVSTQKLTEEQVATIKKDFESAYERPDRPWLAMVDSDKGITNLHAPNDIIIDASMPVVVRDSGKMWNKLGELEDTKCLIPDRCYATMYQEVISFVKTHGQFDVATMGNVVRST